MTILALLGALALSLLVGHYRIKRLKRLLRESREETKALLNTGKDRTWH